MLDIHCLCTGTIKISDIFCSKSLPPNIFIELKKCISGYTYQNSASINILCKMVENLHRRCWIFINSRIGGNVNLVLGGELSKFSIRLQIDFQVATKPSTSFDLLKLVPTFVVTILEQKRLKIKFSVSKTICQ